MANYQTVVTVGDSVWHDFKNGIVDGIDYAEGIIYVDFYDKGRDEFDRDSFIGCFDERLNQWVLGELA